MAANLESAIFSVICSYNIDTNYYNYVKFTLPNRLEQLEFSFNVKTEIRNDNCSHQKYSINKFNKKKQKTFFYNNFRLVIVI